jgi:hypothetical protein
MMKENNVSEFKSHQVMGVSQRTDYAPRRCSDQENGHALALA